MTARPTAVRPADVLIVGGGIAGVEALLALADLGDGALRLSVLSAQRSFTLRPQILGAPWGGPPLRVDLEALCADVGARFTLGTVAAVDAASATVTTTSGTVRAYERLLLAPGARQALPYPLVRVLGFGALPATLATAKSGSVAVVVPPGVTWTLPAYELALLTAAGHPGREVRVLTPEHTPLEVFGPGVRRDLDDLLARGGVRVETERAVAADDGVRGLADTVIALPLPRGPGIAGVPTTAGGFIRTGDRGTVAGLEHVWAAGDASDGPIKQGGLAAQQAAAASAAIVRSCGGAVPQPLFPPVLRGRLTAGDGEDLYLRRVLDGRDVGDAARDPLWIPPSVVCAWRLTRWLAARRPDTAGDLGHVAGAPAPAA